MNLALVMSFAAGVVLQKQAKWLFFNGLQLIGICCFFLAEFGLGPSARFKPSRTFRRRSGSFHQDHDDHQDYQDAGSGGPDLDGARSTREQLRNRIEHLEKMLRCGHCNEYPCRDGCHQQLPRVPYCNFGQ